MTTSLATVLALIPKSDEQLAKSIGISSKTIKRIKTDKYIPSPRIKTLILDYLKRMNIIISDFTNNNT